MASRASMALALLAALTPAAMAQQKRERIDVEHYTVDARIDPRTQTLAATAELRFIPVDEVSSAQFELNNALSVSKVEDASGRQVPASRNQQDFTVRLSFPEALPKGKASTVRFTYDGKLTGNEESPVYGIKFAAIRPEANSYLMYPARWVPVNDYTSDRFTAEMKVSVPTGYRVIASGIEERGDKAADDMVTYRFRFNNPSFPASIAVVKDQPVRVSSQGVSTSLYFREAKEMANAYVE